MIFILVLLAWRSLLYKSLGSKNLTLCKSNKNELLLNFKKFWFKSYLIYITLEWFLWRCNFEPKAYALHTSFGTRFDFQNCCRIYQIRHKMFDTVGIHGHLYFGKNVKGFLKRILTNWGSHKLPTKVNGVESFTFC